MTIPDRIVEPFQRAWLGRDPQAEPALRDAFEQFVADGDPEGIAWCCLGLSYLASIRNDLATAGELLDQGLAVVGDTDRLALARLLNARGALFLEQDRWPGAMGPLVAVSRMAAEFPEEALRAQQNLAFCKLGLRDFSGALAGFRSCLAMGTFEGVRLAYTLYGLGLAAARGGEIEAARGAASELGALDEEARTVIRGMWHAVSAELAALEERWTDVAHHTAEAVTWAVQLGVTSQGQLGHLASLAAEALGDRAGARRAIDVAIGLPLGPYERVDLLRWAAELSRRDGDLETAFRLHDEALSSARDDGTVGRTVAQVVERAADGIQRRELEVTSANEALKRAYGSLDRLRRQLEVRVEERTRALADEVEIRRRAEEVAVRANLSKSRFLANMSHELRTPLNVIIGYAEMLEEELDPGPAADAATIRRSGRHLLGMIDEVLDLTRIEAGHLDVRAIPVDLPTLLDDVATEATALAQRGGNQLLRDGDDVSGAPFTTDPLRLRQILLNLLGNAAKFTERGTITLGARRDGSRLDVWVTDTGIGIDAEHLPRLFEPFEQVDPTSTRRYGGAGLGLAICRELVVVLGGGITADSAPGAGSRFALWVPESPFDTGCDSPATAGG